MFFQHETNKLLKEGIIKETSSPWRAQVLVTKSKNHRKRLVIDYSRTTNRFTNLDAYPLLRIEDQINGLAKCQIFSIFDLKSAYHQIPLAPEDEKYTAFEAEGKLYQFCRFLFGVTNSVAVFTK